MDDEFDEVVDVEAEEITDPGEGEAARAPGQAAAQQASQDAGAAGEGVPVIAEVRALHRPSAYSLPVVQAAAVAATGFVAGAAAAAFVRRRGARRLSRAQGSDRGDNLAVRSTHTYLIRVHVLGRPAE
jgi:hypothetical protein